MYSRFWHVIVDPDVCDVDSLFFHLGPACLFYQSSPLHRDDELHSHFHIVIFFGYKVSADCFDRFCSRFNLLDRSPLSIEEFVNLTYEYRISDDGDFSYLDVDHDSEEIVFGSSDILGG